MLPKIQNKKLILFPKLDFDAAAGIPFQYRMNFDGCSKGNPGLCGAGAVIYHNDNEIWSRSFFVGENATNNRRVCWSHIRITTSSRIWYKKFTRSRGQSVGYKSNEWLIPV